MQKASGILICPKRKKIHSSRCWRGLRWASSKSYGSWLQAHGDTNGVKIDSIFHKQTVWSLACSLHWLHNWILRWKSHKKGGKRETKSSLEFRRPGYIQVLAASSSMSIRLSNSSTIPRSWTGSSTSRVLFRSLVLGFTINLWSVGCREAPRFLFSSRNGKDAGLSAEASEDATREGWSERDEVEGIPDRQATSISLTAASQSKS